MADIDHTILVNHTFGATWKCPHCGRKNIFPKEAESILMRHMLYVTQCEYCGYLHSWELKLTDDFKQKTLDMMRVRYE